MLVNCPPKVTYVAGKVPEPGINEVPGVFPGTKVVIVLYGTVITMVGGCKPVPRIVLVPANGPVVVVNTGTSVMIIVPGDPGAVPGIVLIPDTGPVVMLVTGWPSCNVIISTAGCVPEAGINEVPGDGPNTVDVIVSEGVTVTNTEGKLVPLPATVVVPGVGPVVVIGTIVSMTVAPMLPLAGIVENPCTGPVVIEVTVDTTIVTITSPWNVPLAGIVARRYVSLNMC